MNDKEFKLAALKVFKEIIEIIVPIVLILALMK